MPVMIAPLPRTAVHEFGEYSAALLGHGYRPPLPFTTAHPPANRHCIGPHWGILRPHQLQPISRLPYVSRERTAQIVSEFPHGPVRPRLCHPHTGDHSAPLRPRSSRGLPCGDSTRFAPWAFMKHPGHADLRQCHLLHSMSVQDKSWTGRENDPPPHHFRQAPPPTSTTSGGAFGPAAGVHAR